MSIDRGQARPSQDGAEEKTDDGAVDDERAPRVQFSARGAVPPVAPLGGTGTATLSASELAFGNDQAIVHAAAAEGIASPSTVLPHANKIKASFGPGHDVGRIDAHVGGDSAAAMGASAYASGNHVVFDQQPDLHTAAHEAAHVVQQANGVHLKGGLGEAGDSYEQNADAVADRVVAGQSARDLLEASNHAGGTTSDASVQMKDDKKGMADKEPPISRREIEENQRREKAMSSWREKSQNATFNAMGTTLALLARTLDKTGSDMSFRLALAQKAPRGSAEFEGALQFFNGKLLSLHEQIESVRVQLKELDYHADQYPYLEDGVAALLEAQNQLRPILNDIEAWAGPKADELADVDGWLTRVINIIKPNRLSAPKQVHSQGSNDMGVLVFQNISMHLDGAFAAAHSLASGNIGHEDRIVLHLKEVARWMPKPGEVRLPAFKPRVDELARLLEQVIRDRPYTKATLQEAFNPIRNLP